MRKLAADGVRVQCCVTSPPYFGLRDYGHPGQIGLEKTPAEYVAALVEVFDGVRDLLADDGVLWLNLGSSYMSNTASGPQGQSGQRAGRTFTASGLGAGALRDRHPNQSHQPKHVPACGTDGTALPDSTGADSACFCLCDGCLADFLTHRDRIADTDQQSEQCEPLPSPTSRDSERLGCEPAIPAASLPSVQESTTLESWRQRRGACSRCDTRASSLSMLPTTSRDAQESVRSSWLKYSTHFKQKDMIPIPWMVALALQSAGWYLRQDIIWHKPNPMPESVTDRCTKAHEYLFLLSKNERYYFDQKAIAEPLGAASVARLAQDVEGQRGSDRVPGKTNGTTAYEEGAGEHRTKAGLVSFAERERAKVEAGDLEGTRNRRSVWTVPTVPYSGAHFATFPPALIEPCILAGSRSGDTVLDCFFGSGTTGEVAGNLGRNWIGCDINDQYAPLQRARTAQHGLAL
jgi:hypothetical protein